MMGEARRRDRPRWQADRVLFARRSVGRELPVLLEHPPEAILHYDVAELLVDREHDARVEVVRIAQKVTVGVLARERQQLRVRQALQVVAADERDGGAGEAF